MKKLTLSGSSLLVIGGLGLASVVGYVFNPLLVAPILGTKGVAVLGAFLYLFTLLTFPQTPLSITLIRYASDFNAAGAPGKVTALIRQSMRAVAAAGLIFSAVLVFFSPALAGYLKLESTAPVLAAVALAYIQLVATAAQAPLQGLLRFHHFIATLIADPVVRLAAGALLLLTGFGITGAMTGYLAGALACLAASWFFLRKDMTATGQETFDYRELFSYALPASVYAGYLAFVQSIDGLVVKHYFPDHEAGLYIASASLAKLVLVPVLPLANVAFSYMSDAVSRKQSSSAMMVKTALMAGAFLAAELLLVFLLPETILRFTYGAEFLPAAKILPYSALAVAPLCFVILYSQHGLAEKKSKFLAGLVSGAAVHFTLLLVFHSDLTSLILAHAAGGVIELGLGLFLGMLTSRGKTVGV